MFAPKHTDLNQLVPELVSLLTSPHLSLRQSAVSCLRQLAQRDAVVVCELTSDITVNSVKDTHCVDGMMAYSDSGLPGPGEPRTHTGSVVSVRVSEILIQCGEIQYETGAYEDRQIPPFQDLWGVTLKSPPFQDLRGVSPFPSQAIWGRGREGEEYFETTGDNSETRTGIELELDNYETVNM